MTDPDIERQEQLATDELARRLRGWAAMQDAHAFAATFIADMRAHGWKPPLGTPPDWKTSRRHDPEVAKTGADLARRALAGEDIP